MSDDVIQKGLEQDAQWIAERMPMELDKKSLDSVREKLKAFIKQRELSQAQVAKMLGLSSAKLSQFLTGKQVADVKGVVNKIVNLMDTAGRRDRRSKSKDFVETAVAQKIYTMIVQTEVMSKREGRIGVVIGDAGCGKTLCLQEYAKTNQNTIYIQLDDTMTRKHIFTDIAAEAGIDASGALPMLTRRIATELRPRELTVILDEASGLDVKKLNQLRQIVSVKACCPLILAGNADLLKTIKQPTTKRGSESLDQFTSRLLGVLNLDDLAREDGGAKLYTADDIRNLYEYGGVKLTRDAVAALQRICMTPRAGRLRTCTNIIEALHTSPPVRRCCLINLEMIIQAILELQLPIQDRLPIETLEQVKDQVDEAVAAAG